MTAASTLIHDAPVPSVLLNDDAPRTRLTDPITSHLAADSNIDNLADSRTIVYLLLMERGPLTDNEVVDALKAKGARFTPSRLRTARHELTERNTIEFTGYYRLTPANRRAQVWQIARVSA